MSSGEDHTVPRASLRVFVPGLLLLLMSLGDRPMNAQTGQSNGLTAQERRGKDIYFGLATGITARVGPPPTEAPALLLPCANCHGSDARGKREGTVVAPDIRWDTLTKPYGATSPGGRTHPAYTERSLVRAVSLGFDPGGNSLHPAMPRFQMSHADIEALTQYLRRLPTERPPGVSDSEIRVATLVPAAGPLATASDAARAVLAAYFDEMNTAGGIYGRKLVLSVTQIGSTESDTRASADTLFQQSEPFAIVGGVLTGVDNDVIAVAEALGVPFVGPLTIFPELTAGRSTFYLLSGVEEQARALVDYNGRIAGAAGASMVIIHSAEAVPATVFDRIQDHVRQSGWNARAISLDRDSRTDRAIADELKASTADSVLVLVSGERFAPIATEMAAIGGSPALLVPGSLATDDLLHLPQSLTDRLYVALPSLPSDQTRAALEEYRTLAERYHLTSAHMAWQLAALGSAKVLTRALKDAGRDLTRPALVAALEDLSDFNNGLMPTLRFGRGRHIGARGAYIVTLDRDRKELRQLTGWIRVN